jgi:ABC-2 type transport system permease protein
MFERIHAMLVKEFIQIFRDPKMRGLLFLVPILQILIFGNAARTDVRDVATALYDLDNTSQSRDLTRAFTYSGYFEVKHAVADAVQLRDVIDRSSVTMALRFDRGFGRDLAGGRTADFQLIADGSDSNTAQIAISYANSIAETYSMRLLEDRARQLPGSAGAFPSVSLRNRTWFNENLESKNYYIPGVIALMVTITTLMLSALSIVREKEIGTIEQLIVSPIKPYELIIGKLVPFGVLALVNMVLITLTAELVFKVPFRGSIALLFVSTVVFLLTSLGVGLFISTISSTQQEAVMATFLFFMPANLLSGFMFPLQNMPQIIQYVTYLNPLRYYLTILRGVFLKGVGIEILWPEILILFIMGVAILAVSSLRFHKRLG